MYLGVCVNNDDPEKRGRVQVFVPHVMPALYTNWNEEGKDVKFTCVGDNIIEGLSSEILEKLKKMLPWAEAASPILGTSAPGNLMSGGAGGGNQYNQSPVSSPPLAAPYASSSGGAINGATMGGTNGNWAGSLDKLSGILPAGSWNPSSQKRGRLSTRSGGVSDHYEGKSNAYAVDLGLNSSFGGNSSQATNSAIQIVNNVRAQRGETPISSCDAYKGTAYTTTTPDGYRVQVIWQSNVGGNHYDHIHVGVKYTGSGSGIPASSANQQRTSASGDSPSAPVHALATPKNLTDQAPPSQYGNATNQNHTESSAGLAQSYDDRGNRTIQLQGGNAGISNSKLGQDRQNYFANDLKDPNLLSRISFLANREVGSDTNQQTAWFETVANRAYFSGRSLSSVLNESAYGFIPGTRQPTNGTQTALNNVISGSNLTNLATDNASNVPGNAVADKRISAGVTGSWYKNGQPVSYGTPGAEFLYRADGTGGYSSGAGLNAGKYATSNGIEGVPTNAPTNAPTNIVNNTDPHGPAASQNLNGVAKGLFSFPAAGAMLWCFFREGNPLFPVYFGASYSQAEWQSAYRYTSSGPGYNPVSTNGEPQSTGGIMNLNGVGGIRWEDTNSSSDTNQDQKSIMFFGEDGSNVFFGRGYNQFLSKFDRRDQVEGDRWETTLGYKENWVQGDYNRVVMGDQFIKIGNVGPAAVAAVEEIQRKIKEIQAPLSEGGENAGGGTAGTPAVEEAIGANNNTLNQLQQGAEATGGSYNFATGQVQPYDDRGNRTIQLQGGGSGSLIARPQDLQGRIAVGTNYPITYGTATRTSTTFAQSNNPFSTFSQRNLGTSVSISNSRASYYQYPTYSQQPQQTWSPNVQRLSISPARNPTFSEFKSGSTSAVDRNITGGQVTRLP